MIKLLKAFWNNSFVSVLPSFFINSTVNVFNGDYLEETAELVAAQGIIEKAPVAQKAIPNCNITYIDGEEMKAALSGYLSVLMEQNPESVGGKLPEDDFYYSGM